MRIWNVCVKYTQLPRHRAPRVVPLTDRRIYLHPSHATSAVLIQMNDYAYTFVMHGWFGFCIRVFKYKRYIQCTVPNITTMCEPAVLVIVCPLCEEKSTQCTCHFDFEDEKSCTLQSESGTRICGVCGCEVSSCLCDFQTHDINVDSGVCIKCLLVDPCNQMCSSTSAYIPNVVTSTPKVPRERLGARRKLFEEVQHHYVTTSEVLDSYTKPDFEVHPVRCSKSTFLSAGESLIIKTDIIVTEPVGRTVGFLTIVGNPPWYWLETMTNHCFTVKTGVLRGDFVGGLSVSVINKMSESIVIKEGTNLCFLEFHKFV